MYNEDSDTFVYWKTWMSLGPWVSTVPPPPRNPRVSLCILKRHLWVRCAGGGRGGGGRETLLKPAYSK